MADIEALRQDYQESLRLAEEHTILAAQFGQAALRIKKDIEAIQNDKVNYNTCMNPAKGYAFMCDECEFKGKCKSKIKEGKAKK